MKKEYIKPDAEVMIFTLKDAILTSIGGSESEAYKPDPFDPDPNDPIPVVGGGS